MRLQCLQCIMRIRSDMAYDFSEFDLWWFVLLTYLGTILWFIDIGWCRLYPKTPREKLETSNWWQKERCRSTPETDVVWSTIQLDFPPRVLNIAASNDPNPYQIDCWKVLHCCSSVTLLRKVKLVPRSSPPLPPPTPRTFRPARPNHFLLPIFLITLPSS